MIKVKPCPTKAENKLRQINVLLISPQLSVTFILNLVNIQKMNSDHKAYGALGQSTEPHLGCSSPA